MAENWLQIFAVRVLHHHADIDSRVKRIGDGVGRSGPKAACGVGKSSESGEHRRAFFGTIFVLICASSG